MNITSMLVGITVMGIAAPQIANMSLQPVIAQKRAENFGVAESAAVIFAAHMKAEKMNLSQPMSVALRS